MTDTYKGQIVEVNTPEKSKDGTKFRPTLIKIAADPEGQAKHFRVWPYEDDQPSVLYTYASQNYGKVVTVVYEKDEYTGAKGKVTQNIVKDFQDASGSLTGVQPSQTPVNGSSPSTGLLSAAQEQRVREIVREELLGWGGGPGTAPPEDTAPPPNYEGLKADAKSAGFPESAIQKAADRLGFGDWKTLDDAQLGVIREAMELGADWGVPKAEVMSDGGF